MYVCLYLCVERHWRSGSNVCVCDGTSSYKNLKELQGHHKSEQSLAQKRERKPRGCVYHTVPKGKRYILYNIYILIVSYCTWSSVNDGERECGCGSSYRGPQTKWPNGMRASTQTILSATRAIRLGRRSTGSTKTTTSIMLFVMKPQEIIIEKCPKGPLAKGLKVLILGILFSIKAMIKKAKKNH